MAGQRLLQTLSVATVTVLVAVAVANSQLASRTPIRQWRQFRRPPSLRAPPGFNSPTIPVIKRVGGDSNAGFLEFGEIPPKLIGAREHGEVILDCSASGSPPPKVFWYKDGKPLFNDSEDEGSTIWALGEVKTRLTLDCMSKKDSGIYECAFESGKREKGLEIEVGVTHFPSKRCDSYGPNKARPESAPRIFQWMVTYVHVIGAEARLTCRAIGADVIEWTTPDGSKVTQERDIIGHKILPNGDLFIERLTFDDMGMYKCIASNNHGTETVETFVYPVAG